MVKQFPDERRSSVEACVEVWHVEGFYSGALVSLPQFKKLQVKDADTPN